MGVVLSEPGKPQDQRQTRLVQDVELDPFQVVTGEEHVHWSSLMGDGAQPVTIQGPDCNGKWQRLDYLPTH